jgi:hypothetical protein
MMKTGDPSHSANRFTHQQAQPHAQAIGCAKNCGAGK